MAGFFYLLSQIALLLGVFVVLSFLAGHYLWPGAQRAASRADAETTSAEVVDLERQLSATQATVHELRTTVTTITDHKDAEMGRLESRAIQAMDSLIASHQERVDAMQALLEATRSQARYQERELEAERRHTLRLQAALVERDELIGKLTTDLDECTKRWREANGRPTAAASSEPPTSQPPALPDMPSPPEMSDQPADGRP